MRGDSKWAHSLGLTWPEIKVIYEEQLEIEQHSLPPDVLAALEQQQQAWEKAAGGNAEIIESQAQLDSEPQRNTTIPTRSSPHNLQSALSSQRNTVSPTSAVNTLGIPRHGLQTPNEPDLISNPISNNLDHEETSQVLGEPALPAISKSVKSHNVNL